MPIDTKDKSSCCGCGACAVVCPSSCIRMVKDEEGFDYPRVESERCVDCGACLSVCAIQSGADLRPVQGTYAAWHRNPSIRAIGTSGSLFTALAEGVLAEGGLVAGAAFAEDFRSVRHILVDTVGDLAPLQGSKYVQSSTEECFADIRNYLLQGKLVLFTGTPCQVASLRKLVKEGPGTLLAVDIVCHGVPSPSVFSAYMDGLERRYNERIAGYSFRDKQRAGWNSPAIAATYASGRTASSIPWLDPYFCGYSLNAFLRPSCYSCPYACRQRSGDITIADCWRVAASHPQYDDNKGTSLVLVNSKRGQEWWEKLVETEHVFSGDYDLDLACQRNAPLHGPAKAPLEIRDEFFELFRLTQDFASASRSYLSPSLRRKKWLAYWVKRLGWPMFRRMQ